MKTQDSYKSARKYARIAGFLYLMIILCGMSSEMLVRSSLIVPGDATATTQHIMASPSLFRLGFVSDLIMVLCDVAVAMVFYILLKPVSKGLSLLAAFFRLVQSAILGMNLLHYFTPLLLLNNPGYLTAFGTEQLHAQVMLHLEAHSYGYLISGVFFAFSCLVLGYLFFTSDYFPKVLGVLLVIASLGYLIDCFTNFLSPDYAAMTEWVVVISAVTAELTLCLWLLLKGVKRPSSL